MRESNMDRWLSLSLYLLTRHVDEKRHKIIVYLLIFLKCGASCRNESYGKLEHLWHENFDFALAQKLFSWDKYSVCNREYRSLSYTFYIVRIASLKIFLTECQTQWDI